MLLVNHFRTADQLFNVPFTKAVPGTPCNNFLGYCDVFHICREVCYLNSKKFNGM